MFNLLLPCASSDYGVSPRPFPLGCVYIEQMATVVGHAMTESNLASLMSSISEMSRRSDEGNTKAGEAGTGDGRGRSEMSFFEFHRIFQDLL